jgi:ribulose-5-phosphate 4-epimerase/fuculose-1-phosphate aldolase
MTPIEEILAGCRILDGEGLTDAFGHLSCRVPGCEDVLITARIGPGLVRTPDDVLRVSFDGSVLDGDPALLPGEAALHLGLLRARPDVASVCRFHGPYCFAWATLGQPLPATSGMALMVGAPVPVHDTALTITTLDAAAACAESLGASGGVLLRGFGAVTVGASVPQTIVRATFLERAAATVLRAQVVGSPHEYTTEQAAAFAARTAVIDEQVRRAWTYLCDKWPVRTAVAV